MKILQYDNTDKKLYYDLINLSIKQNIDYSKQYFTTEMLETGSISFSILSFIGTEYIESISYSLDNGNTWITTENTNNKQENLVITVNAEKNDIILWKGIAKQLAIYYEDEDDYFGLISNSEIRFNAYGNIMSLLYGDDFIGKTEFKPNSNHQFSNLFSDHERECNIVDASNLILPVLNLSESCYEYMFYNCSSLIKAPELPAMTLADSCYNGMFGGCSSLTSTPKLPATILADSCYSGMFSECSSLTEVPELPATTLTQGCYSNMFHGCTSLTNAPELPAITLSIYCYSNMFSLCSSLTIAPELPATTLAGNCYGGMFDGCTKLNYIKALFTTTPSSDYTNNWVKGVAATGTFVKNSNATWNEVGTYAVPSGWTIETANK